MFKKMLSPAPIAPKPGEEANRHRDEGDRLRDAGNFKAAAAAYERHLVDHPDDFGIWVQRGNCLKDSGGLDAAKIAYDRAISLRPDDADVHLQLGHLYKLMGQRALARGAYEKSMQLQPSVKAAAEFTAVGGKRSVVDAYLGQSREPAFLFEFDDFIFFLKVHPTPTGIQRVQAGLLQSITALHADKNIHFVTREVTNGRLRLKKLDTDELLTFVEFLAENSDKHEMIRDKLARIEQSAIEIKPRKGDIYTVLGAFWNRGADASRAYLLLKDAGVCVGAYVYDLIPITHPQFCEQNLTREFTLCIGDSLRLFDFVFTISEFTANELKRFIAKHDIPPLPVTPVPLAHVLTTMAPAEGDELSPAVEALRGKPFALFVSTIEARKNHALVVAAWQQMLSEGLDPPDLVFLGRRGWRVDPLFDLLEATEYLDGRIHILHDLSDVDLQQVYAWAQFTLFPSFVEGWGLPVGESLVAGKPCVASSTSSIPEIGGDLVDYIDPLEARTAIAAIKRMCFDEAYREARRKNIEKNFRPRTWRDVGADFFGQLAAYAATNPVSRPVEQLRLAELQRFDPGRLTSTKVTESYAQRPWRLALVDGWSAPEPFGVWMIGRRGSLVFSTDLKEGAAVNVVVTICATDTAADVKVRPTVGERPRSDEDGKWFNCHPEARISIHGQVGKRGELRLSLDVRGKYARSPGEARDIAIGLKSLIYIEAANLDKRLQLIEEFLFVS